MPKVEGIQRATGRSRAEWFSALDEWGAPGRPFREISAWLTTKHRVSKWWAQKIIVEYEEARGLRPPGIRPDGSFTVSTSKTISAPVEVLFKAFVDGRRRKRWIGEMPVSVVDSAPSRSARFDWADGPSRVNVTFMDKGREKATVVVSHERLPRSDEAQAIKARWKERLADLKSLLES